MPLRWPLPGPTSGFKLTALTWNGSGSSDANGDALSYTWNLGDSLSATTSTPTTTHSYAAVGSYRMTLTVNDGETSSSPATADVAIQSRPPIANAGPDQTVVQRTTVGLNGGASTDPDGTIGSVRWLQVAGPAVTLSGSTTLSPTFAAPRVSTATKLTFELTVTDNDGVLVLRPCGRERRAQITLDRGSRGGGEVGKACAWASNDRA